MNTPHWSGHWKDIAAHVAGCRQLLLACDFDGTLAPIVARQEDANLSDGMRALLRRFALCPGVTLAFVSGRALADVRARVGIEQAIYCGNHGLEIAGPDFAWTSPEATLRRPGMAAAVSVLRASTAELHGVLIEDKGLSTTVHWRLASEESREKLRPLVAAAVENHAGLRLAHGKAVWELRPRVDWDKGAALRLLLGRVGLQRTNALFLGDDETDESAFRALPDGVTLRVGEPAATAARFHARDVADAAGFLFCLFSIRTSSPDCGRTSGPTTALEPSFNRHLQTHPNMSTHPYIPATVQRRERLVNLADLRRAAATESAQPSGGAGAPHLGAAEAGEDGSGDLHAS